MLGLPELEGPARFSKLAIVGSGPSIEEELKTLQQWDGEIWAINGAWRWLRDRGVEAIFFTIDPTESIIVLAEAAPNLILHANVHPKVFKEALFRGARIRLFNPPHYTGGYSAIGAAFAAFMVGFPETTFFGCECSHVPERVHVHSDQRFSCPIVVGVADAEFLTRAVYYHQCLELSQLIRAFPKQLKERSGGMLRAMVQLPTDTGINLE